MDPARGVPAGVAGPGYSAARRSPRASSPRSSWPSTASSKWRRNEAFAPLSSCGERPDGRARCARSRRRLFAVDRAAEHRTRSPRMSAKGTIADRAGRAGGTHMPAAASSSSSAAGVGISRPRPISPISCAARARNRGGCRARRPRRLAIVAYHEPVSRAEIEAIRGVQISKGTLDVLMDAGWVRPAGRREGPGPAVALCDDAGVPDPFRPRPRGATCRASTTFGRRGCSTRSTRPRFQLQLETRRTKATR